MGCLKRALQFSVITVMTYLLLSPTVFADGSNYVEKITPGTTGNYIGISFGGTNLHAPDKDLRNNAGQLVLVRPSNMGFGYRLYWGYLFTTNLGIEGGYLGYSPAIYKIPNGHQPELRIQAGGDLVGKGILPLFWGISAFIKAGVALVYYKQGGLLAPNPQPGGGDGSQGITIRPEIGLGGSYAFAPNWSVDLSYTRLTAGGVIPASDYYSIGLTYHAVDLYCGQFLC